MKSLNIAIVAFSIVVVQLVYPVTVSVPVIGAAAAAAGIYVAGESAKHPNNAGSSNAVSSISVTRVKVPEVPDDSSIVSIVRNFSLTHAGTYKVSVTELSGALTHVAVDGDATITTASTYKLFVAYSTIRAVEAGTWSWSDITTTGQDVSTCFDLMITDSDNDCAIALLLYLGYSTIEGDASDQGATHTTFLDDDITSTADDEALLLTKLGLGTLPISADDSLKWLNAMKANEYRDGIPSGLANIDVADKVGFLDDLLHDAAIVFSPTGTYVLVILTEGSTWADIAELSSEIEASRLMG